MANTIAIAAAGFTEVDVPLLPFSAPCSLLTTADILYPVITDVDGNATFGLVALSIPTSLSMAALDATGSRAERPSGRTTLGRRSRGQ